MVPDTPDLTIGRGMRNLACLLAAVITFAACFIVAHSIALPRLSRSFNKLLETEKADFSSRVHSTLHAVLVVVGAFVSCSYCNMWWNPLVNDCQVAEGFYSVSVGYFLFDLGLLVYFKTDLWQMFVVHHVVATTPYLLNTFIPGASHCHFLLSCMITVETSTIFLNAQWWLEKTSRVHTSLYTVTFYTTYITWFVFRVVNPAMVVVLVISKVIPVYKSTSYVVPSYISVFTVALFCWYCWVAVFTPELLQRWQTKSKTSEGIELEEVLTGTIDKDDKRKSDDFKPDKKRLRSSSSHLLLHA